MHVRAVWIGAFASALCGCTATRQVSTVAYASPVAVLSATESIPGTELGPVVVSGADGDGDTEMLLPLFMQRVAELGGNTAVIETVRTRFETVGYHHPNPGICGSRNTVHVCAPTKAYTRVRIVVMRGRAFSVPVASRGDPRGPAASAR